MRWLHKLYANFFRYFWLPCDRCGRRFGGHEVRADHATLVLRMQQTMRCLCPRCTKQLHPKKYVDVFDNDVEAQVFCGVGFQFEPKNFGGDQRGGTTNAESAQGEE